ncbi:MAG: DUF6445 family protein [Pseudomonadota bacterium]
MLLSLPDPLNITRVRLGEEPVEILKLSNIFKAPEAQINAAAGARFEQINPHYPGLRAPVSDALLHELCCLVGTLLSGQEGDTKTTWEGQAWYSIVTRKPQDLTPIQRLPHFDGFDPDQVAIMIYLGHSGHGGTAFFRQAATGYERITEARYPAYKNALESSIARTGLPAANYISDGAPHFHLLGASKPDFNSLILYPGNALHSGVIANDQPLPADPKTGRLTLNGFFRPG